MKNTSWLPAMIGLFVLIALLPGKAWTKNGDISYWTKDLSEMKSGEIIGLPDYSAELAVCGQTVHALWIADSAYTKKMIYYRRSLDGGQTWEDRQMVFSDEFNDLLSYSQQERLAVDGNTVHIVINGYGQGATWFGKLTYLRSTDNGATFEAPRVLFSAADAFHVLDPRVRAENGQVMILYRNQCNWLATNGGRLLVSEDGGDTFQDRGVYYTETGAAWYIADLCWQGDNVYVLYKDAYYYYGLQYGNLYLAASTDGGQTFDSQLISVPSSDGDHMTHPLYDQQYHPKIAADGDNVSVIWSGLDENDVLCVFVRRSTDNGQTFEPAVNLTASALPEGLSIQPGHETIAAKSGYVYAIFNTAQGKLFFTRSTNSGQSFEPIRRISKTDGARYVDGGWWPLVQIDPNDASGQTVHLLWSGFTHDISADGGVTFRGPALLSPHFSWSGTGPRIPQMAIDTGGRLHIVQEGGWSWYASTGYGDQDIFYRRYDPSAAMGSKDNQALKLDYFPPPYDESGEERFDNMQIPPHDDLAFSEALTAEMWFKLDGDAGLDEMRLLVKENELSWSYAPRGYQLGLHVSGNLYINGGIRTTTGEYMLWSGHAMVPETWTHLALTYDSTGTADNLRLYVNGELSLSGTATGGITGGDGILFVGATQDYKGTQGTIDELRLWNRALSETEIRNNMSASLTGSEPGLVAYYPFNGTTCDATGHGHDGVLMYKESFVPSSLPTAVEERIPDALPLQTALLPNYPNPFNPETRISFSLSKQSKVEITVYNIVGQVVEVLLDRELDAGHHAVRWNGADAASGVYFCRMKTGDFVQSRRMVLVK